MSSSFSSFSSLPSAPKSGSKETCMTQDEFMISMVGFLTFAALVCTGLSWTLFSLDDPDHHTHELIKVITITLLVGLLLLCLYALYHWNSKMLLHFGWFLIAISLIFLYTEMVLERYQRDELLPASIAMSIVSLVMIFVLRRVWVGQTSTSTSTSTQTSTSTSTSTDDNANREKNYNDLVKAGKIMEAAKYRKDLPLFDAYMTKKGK